MNMKKKSKCSIRQYQNDFRLMLKDYQLMFVLMLFTLTERGLSLGLNITQTSESVVVRVIRPIFELLLGVLILKGLANGFGKKLPKYLIPKITSQPST